MNNQLCLVTAAGVLEDLTGLSAGWGWLDLHVSQSEGLAAIEAYTHGQHFDGIRMGGRTRDLPERHRLRTAQLVPRSAVWYRGKTDVPLAEMHRFMRRRPQSAYPVAEFREFVNQGWVEPSNDGVFYVVVEDRSTDPRRWTAWDLAGGEAVPARLLIYDKTVDPSSVYADHWPQQEIGDATVAVVGVGSAAALALVDYEVEKIVLIDDDRLQPHNIARHRCGLEDIGRFKVDAVADLLRSASQKSVTPLRSTSSTMQITSDPSSSTSIWSFAAQTASPPAKPHRTFARCHRPAPSSPVSSRTVHSARLSATLRGPTLVVFDACAWRWRRRGPWTRSQHWISSMELARLIAR